MGKHWIKGRIFVGAEQSCVHESIQGRVHEKLSRAASVKACKVACAKMRRNVIAIKVKQSYAQKSVAAIGCLW